MKKMINHGIAIIGIAVLAFLAIASATTPTVPVELSEEYRKMTQPPVGNERVIDGVRVNGSSTVCRDGNDSVSQQRMGATAQVSEDRVSQGHPHEPIIKQLLNEAKRKYPSEEVDIRNASIGGLRHINPRQEQYQTSERGGDGKYYSVTKTRTIYDHYVFYIADVITTEPMPQPVTHSENFTKPGATRADINRLALNWLEDNTQRRRIRIDSQDFDRGRIRGTVTCAARADNTYIVTSDYTIDVFDARVEIRFSEAILRRTDPELQSAGNPEKIFLQSIADAAMAEIVDFSTTLKSYILSR